VAVMQHGRIVESLSVDALCSGAAQHPYTRMLVDASHSYSREMAEVAEA
jgi:peptide/nickel transport system ATP-binding protein